MATDYEKTQELKGLKLYKLNDVRKFIGVGEKTLQGYAREGKLKAVKIGNSWRVTEDALREFLKTEKKD